jgi:DnaJ-class molecular chaperone
MRNLAVFISIVGLLTSFVYVNSSSGEVAKVNSAYTIEHSDVCPDCNGAGNLICTTCDGDRYIPHTIDCSKCAGKSTRDGYIDCLNCKGTGNVDCPNQYCKRGLSTTPCNGCSGKSEKEIDKCTVCRGMGSITVDCETCEGRGTVRDEICDGRGDFECTNCEGSGEIDGKYACEDCNGAGYKKCIRCKGTGEIGK